MNNTCIVIPARYQSTRFPGKPLIKLLGKPMIIWVAELASEAVGKSNVYIATDDMRIEKTVNNFGFQSIFTGNCLTGTDRVAEAAEKLNYNIIVNLQGDEPLVDPDDILRAIDYKIKYPNSVINSYSFISQSEDPTHRKIPKVVTNENEDLIYISRALIPLSKDHNHNNLRYKKQVCIYAYFPKELKLFVDFGRKSNIEKIEDIEILRFFELGINIKMFETLNPSLAVDIMSDIASVQEQLLNKYK